jgi:hypothetical protein
MYSKLYSPTITCSVLLFAFFLSGCAATRDGITPLLQAARTGDLEQVQHQLSKGADVNQGSAFGWTALMFAAWKGNEEVVVRLLDAGADPNRMSKRIARNTQGPTAKTTALAQAIKNNHLAIARILMARGAEADPISVALAAGLQDNSLLKVMVGQGADVDRSAGVVFVSTPLITACKSGRLENVKWLVDEGAAVSRGALAAAAVNLRYEVAVYLLGDNKARNVFTEEDKSFVLFWVAIKQDTRIYNFNSHLRMVKLLLTHGANPHYRAENSYPANMTASEHVKRRRKKDDSRFDSRGPFYQEHGKKWYEHRSAIIDMLEKAEVEYGPDDLANRPAGLAKYSPLTKEQESRSDASGGNWAVSFEEEHYLGFVVMQRSQKGEMAQNIYWGYSPSKNHHYYFQHFKEGSDSNELTFGPAMEKGGESRLSTGSGITFKFSDPKAARRQRIYSIDRRFKTGGILLGRRYGLYTLESSGKPVFILWVVFAKNTDSMDVELKEEFERYWSKQ